MKLNQEFLIMSELWFQHLGSGKCLQHAKSRLLPLLLKPQMCFGTEYSVQTPELQFAPFPPVI